jgi:GTPase SAR1 family protein
MRITLLGLSKVGKSSLVKHCIQSKSLHEFEEIKPTILKDVSNQKPIWYNESIHVIDLAGQESYLPTHLNEENFSSSQIIIFVIDVQEVDRVEKMAKYFSEVRQLLQRISSNPLPAVFLHKYDPAVRKTLQKNVSQYLLLLKDIFDNNIPSLYLTSLYDDSDKRAIGQLILRRSQELVIKIALSDISFDTSHIHPYLSKEKILSDLYLLGQEIGIASRKKWLKAIVENKEAKLKEPAFLFEFLRVEDKTKIVINLTQVPSHTTASVTKSEIVEEIFKGISKPLFFSYSVENSDDKLIFTIKK